MGCICTGVYLPCSYCGTLIYVHQYKIKQENHLCNSVCRAKFQSMTRMGHPVSQETRIKIGQSRKGKTFEEIYGVEKAKELKLNLSRAFKGMIRSPEFCANLSKGKMGHFTSEETRKKIGLANARWTNVRLKGKTWEEIHGMEKAKEMKLKHSIAMTGHIFPPDFGAKISKLKVGHLVNEETRKKISLANMGISKNKGRKATDETKKRMSIARKGQKPWNTGKKGILLNTGRTHFKKGHFSWIPEKDTLPERKLQEALIQKGIIFQKHKSIYGQPDIFIEPNICVFADGDFWHGNPEKYPASHILCGNKTAGMMFEKDKRVNQKLIEKGFIVLRFWEKEIIENLPACINQVLELVKLKSECDINA